MEFLVIPTVAFIASLLTFFSGFGLGTLLLPVFVIWFPVDLAVTLTAIVHLLNNVFKLILVGIHANKSVIFKFGIPAILSAFVGATLLVKVSNLQPLLSYQLFNQERLIMPIKLIIAILMMVFTFFELLPKFKNLQISPKYLVWGGLLSGFFGGLSGHQGALRSAFLIRLGLSKESFIATGVVIACFIDLIRLGVYSEHFTRDGLNAGMAITSVATISAFTGAYIGNKFLNKMTMGMVQIIVSIGIFILALALGFGLI